MFHLRQKSTSTAKSPMPNAYLLVGSFGTMNLLTPFSSSQTSVSTLKMKSSQFTLNIVFETYSEEEYPPITTVSIPTVTDP